MSKNAVTKKKTFQCVVPEALRCLVLKGVHDKGRLSGSAVDFMAGQTKTGLKKTSETKLTGARGV